MRVISNERIIPVDVDGTLIKHITSDQVKELSKEDEIVLITDPVDNNNVILALINQPMVRLLIEESTRGAHILVWSRGGFQWANNVIQALKIEDYVDTIMSKPLVYFDDVNVSDWLKDRVFLSPETIYKTKFTKE